MANDNARIRVTAQTDLTLGTSEHRLPLRAQLQAFGGPLSFSIQSRASFSFDDIWNLIRNALKEMTGLNLPAIPDGPWNLITDTDFYPALWFEPGPRAPQGKSNVQFALTLAKPLKIGGTSHIGPVQIEVEPNFTVRELVVGGNKNNRLGISAVIDMPTTTSDGTGGTVTKVVDYPFPVPAQKSSPTLQVHYLGLGQRIGPKPVLNPASTDPLTEIFDAIEDTFTVNDPKSVLTDLAKNYYNTSLGWFIAADVSIKTFRIKVLFNDPALYGLEITVADKPRSFLSGLRFEILYQRVGPNLGVYFAAVDLPTAMRRIPMEGFILILPGFSLWIYTNGDFRVNVGWPVGRNSLGISWDILTGWAGFYFAKLRSGDNPGANPSVAFNPILMLGFGFRLEAGVSIDAGIFSASMSISTTATMQGLLAWKQGQQVTDVPDAYWYAGTFEVKAMIKGAVNFVLIKVSVTISLSFRTDLAVENGFGTELVINAEVTARASVKLVFFSVHFSFHTSIRQHIRLVSSDRGYASVDGPKQPGLLGMTDSEALETLLLSGLGQRVTAEQPVPRAWREPLFPPPRLAPEVRGFRQHRPDADLTTVLSAPVSDRVTVHVKFVLQGTALYSATGDDDQFGLVGLLLLGGRDPGSTADADTRTDFEDLVSRLVCWLLNMPLPAITAQQTLSGKLAALLAELQRIKHDNPLAFAEVIQRFFQARVTFRITGVDGTVEPSEEDRQRSWTALPMFDQLTLTTNGTARDFQHYQPIPPHYATAVDLYFDGLSLFGEPAGGPQTARVKRASKDPSMATFLFADFYLMLSQHVISELQDAAEAYERIDPSAPLQTELDSLLDAYDYASTAGFVSRALLGGQQLPDPARIPDPVTAQNIHNVPTGAVFALSGQQLALAATGTATTARATLTFSDSSATPDWLDLVGSSAGQPPTATFRLPAVVPPQPVPHWGGEGLAPLPAGQTPAGDAGSLTFSPMPVLEEIALRLTSRSQTVWTPPAEEQQAIVPLPAPLQARITTAQAAISVRLGIARDGREDAPLEALAGRSGLIFDLPITQVNQSAANVADVADVAAQGSANDDTHSDTLLGVVPNLYQIGATDDEARSRLQQVIEQGSAVKVSLLYVDSSGEGVKSDALDPASILLSRTNLSTENQARQAPRMLRLQAAAPARDPAFAAMSEVSDFLRLIWEVSVVNADGFYLFYRNQAGNGLPAELFARTGISSDSNDTLGPQPIDDSSGETATLRVLVELQDSPQQQIPMPAGSNCVIASALVKQTASIDVFADGTALSGWHSGMNAGDMGLALTWQNPNNAPPVIGEIHAAALYNLIQFNVQGQAGSAGEIWSLPLSPTQHSGDETADGRPDLGAEAGPQQYQQVFQAWRFLQQNRVDAAAENVYALAGADVALQFRLTDIFGNALPAQAKASETGVYHDPLFNVGQWPMVQASHHFMAADAGHAQAWLVVSLAFDSKALDQLLNPQTSNDPAPQNMRTQVVAMLRQYGLIHQQLTDPGTHHRLSSTLLGEHTDDVAATLAGFAQQIIQLLEAQLEGAVPVDDNNEVAPLQQTLQVAVPFSSITALQHNSVPVRVSITASRHDHLAPELAEKLPDAVHSQADILPRRADDLTALVTTLTAGTPPTAGGDNQNSSLTVYAQQFEKAFKGFNGHGGMLKLAERAGLTADADAHAVDTLWAVRFDGAHHDSSQPANGIRTTFDPQRIAYFALPPLNISPVSRAVDGTLYNSVDMDLWNREIFSAIDSLFDPELNMAITRIASAAPDAHDQQQPDQLSAAKQSIADAMSKTLVPILLNAPRGDQPRAAAQLKQAMLTRLSAAYDISTLMQLPARVSGATTSGTDTASQLFGRVGPPLTGDTAQDHSRVYDLSSGRLDLADGDQWSTVMVSVTDQGAQRALTLPLVYNISALQQDFDSDDAFDGYTPSTWLNFILPDGVLDMDISADHPVTIPIPLPFEPTAPSLTGQRALGASIHWQPGDGLEKLINEALGWHYLVAMNAPIEAQDQLYLDAIFGMGHVPPHTSDVDDVTPVNLALFDAMARFRTEWAGFAPKLPQILALGQSDNPGADATLRQAIAHIVQRISDIATAWHTPLPLALFASQEPEVIHYRLRVEHNPAGDALQLTFAGWTKGTQGAVKPTRWPEIDLLAGQQWLGRWTVTGDDAIKVQDGDQDWWQVTYPLATATQPDNFRFNWQHLNLSQRQMGRLQSWVRRNDGLVADHATSPAFIYETNTVSFASPGVPLIDRQLNTPVTVDPDSTLTGLLTTLLTPLDFSQAGLDACIRCQAALRYNIATPAEGTPLQASYPLILQPDLILGTDGDSQAISPATAAHQLAAAIARRRADFVGQPDQPLYLTLSLTLFGTQQGQQVPLVNIDGLALDVTGLAPTWWNAPA